MSFLKIERVNALPGTLEASTMYIVKSAEAGLAEVFFSNNDGSEARHVISKADISAMIAGQITDFTNINVVPTIAARDAMAPTRNVLVLALDATGDPTVTAGAALYIYDAATTTWSKVSEFESLDVVLTWEAIQNKPVSSVGNIDDAVAKRHSHANAAELAKIGQDAQGNLTYDGAYIQVPLAQDAW